MTKSVVKFILTISVTLNAIHSNAAQPTEKELQYRRSRGEQTTEQTDTKDPCDSIRKQLLDSKLLEGRDPDRAKKLRNELTECLKKSNNHRPQIITCFGTGNVTKDFAYFSSMCRDVASCLSNDIKTNEQVACATAKRNALNQILDCQRKAKCIQGSPVFQDTIFSDCTNGEVFHKGSTMGYSDLFVDEVIGVDFEVKATSKAECLIL